MTFKLFQVSYKSMHQFTLLSMFCQFCRLRKRKNLALFFLVTGASDIRNNANLLAFQASVATAIASVQETNVSPVENSWKKIQFVIVCKILSVQCFLLPTVLFP